MHFALKNKIEYKLSIWLTRLDKLYKYSFKSIIEAIK